MDEKLPLLPPGVRHPQPLLWAVLFAVAWCLGMGAVLLASGATIGATLSQALPAAVALGVLAYVLRRHTE